MLTDDFMIAHFSFPSSLLSPSLPSSFPLSFSLSLSLTLAHRYRNILLFSLSRGN